MKCSVCSEIDIQKRKEGDLDDNGPRRRAVEGEEQGGSLKRVHVLKEVVGTRKR